MIYLPLSQIVGKNGEGIGDSFAYSIALRTSGEPASTIQDLRTAIASVDPNLPLLQVRTIQEHLETFMASVAQFLSHPDLRGPLDNLASVVRTGRTTLPGAGTVEPENPVWVQFAEQMAPMMGPMAAPLGAVVLDGHEGPMRVLDIAAGHGTFLAAEHFRGEVSESGKHFGLT